MNYTNEAVQVQQLPWFKHWFDSAYYHKLYANRDEKEAGLFIDRLLNHLQPPRHSAMLDVGCGAGRHCRQLASKGFNVTGIDLAFSSIKEAMKCETKSLRFFRHDMRIPFGKCHFDYVFSFFTSFGYFTEQSQNCKVISNMSESLKRNGKIVLDYLNVKYAEDQMVFNEEREIDGSCYRITRWTDNAFFYKRIVIDGQQSGKFFEFTEQVARFDLDCLDNMLATYNLQTEEVFGDYGLGKYDSKCSPRLILIAKKDHD